MNTAWVSIVQMSVTCLACIVSIISLIISNKSTKDALKKNTKQNHFSTLVELYRLGRSFTSNMNDFYAEINSLKEKIKENKDNPNAFEQEYHTDKYDKLREAIGYFDFIQKLLRDESLSEHECYNVISFPLKLYKNMNTVIEFSQNNRLHDFDRFKEFCDRYISHMKKRREDL